MTLPLIKNQDIISMVANHKARPCYVVGFAAETENIIDNAKNKLIQKNLDMIVANDVSASGSQAVDYAQGWGLVRPSNTTPCLVLRFEANDEDTINFRHTKRGSLRIIDELPDQLVETLLAETEMRFLPVPEPDRDELVAAGYIEIDRESE